MQRNNSIRYMETMRCTSSGIVHLHKRSLMILKGDDVSMFLQGMVTCDMFQPGDTKYAMFLNAQVSKYLLLQEEIHKRNQFRVS